MLAFDQCVPFVCTYNIWVCWNCKVPWLLKNSDILWIIRNVGIYDDMNMIGMKIMMMTDCGGDDDDDDMNMMMMGMMMMMMTMIWIWWWWEWWWWWYEYDGNDDMLIIGINSDDNWYSKLTLIFF